MYRYYLAHRFMVSRPINLLGMMGVMLGVWALIVVVSIFDGYREELRSQFTMTTSDIVVYNVGNRAQFDAVREVIEADTNVAACSPRLVWVGLIHPRDESEIQAWVPGSVEQNGRFITVTGIDPELESKTTDLRSWVDAAAAEGLGVDLASLRPGENWMLVSTRKAAAKKHAKKLEMGAELEVTTGRIHYHERQSPTAQFLSSGFRLAGGYKTRHAGFDNLTVLVSIDHLRGLIAKANPQQVNEIAIRLHSTEPRAVLETRDRLQDALGALREIRAPRVLIAGEDEQGFMQAIVHQSGLMKLVLFVIMVVAGFLIYATLSMMVTEKRHDIGVLSALGGTRVGVMQVFLTCGFAISLIGTILGSLSGCLTSIYLDDFNRGMKAAFGIDLFPTDVYNLHAVPYDLDPTWISIVVVSSLALGLLVSVIPAERAMARDPLQCLRNN